MSKVYVAFSIHGTCAFITATKNHMDIKDLPKGFTLATSRRPSHEPEKDGHKLHWDRLLKADGQPLRSAPMIMSCFNDLEKNGWTVDKKKFIDRHWKKKVS
jgi:hypothetical protein